VVRLVEGARGRVLDREKGIPSRARLRLAQGAREGREAAELDRPLTVAEVLPRGEVAVGALGALKRHAMRVTERALGDLPVEKRLLLDLHGHRDDLAEDLRGAEGVEAQLAGDGLDARAKPRLAVEVAQERDALAL